MHFVDSALARRLESAEEMPQVYHARADQKLRPEIGSAAEPIAGGHMIFAGLGSPIGRATGVGFSGPVTAAELDRIEDFYRSRHAPAQVDVCPLTDMDLQTMLKDRGYVMAELNNVLFRPISADETVPEPPEGVVLRSGRPQEALQFADIVGRCFHEACDPPEGFADMLAPLFQMPGALTSVAEIDGEVAGVAAALVISEHRILALFGAGTLPQYRRRGIQTALLRRRMQEGARAGCEFAVTVTRGGTTSQHNAERLGFWVAYSKATVIKTV